MKPERIQRKRTKGWVMPDNTVYVGRPTKWGNRARIRDLSGGTYIEWPGPGGVGVMFHYGIRGDLYAEALKIFRDDQAQYLPVHELRGKNLACWCPLDQPCHADVLLELANA